MDQLIFYLKTIYQELRTTLVFGRKEATMRNNKQRYNHMFAETPDKDEEKIEDGLNVTEQVKPESKSPVLKKYRAKVNVNFRLSPDIKRTDNIIGTLKMMEVVTQIDDTFKDGFIHVEYEKKKGYIQLQFLEEV